MLLSLRVTGPLLAGIAVTILSLASTAVQAQDTIKLTFSTYWPTSYTYLYKPMEAFVERVESQSNGRVDIEMFHSGQLFGGKEEFGAVERGDIDMSAPLDIYHTGKVPALGISSLPFMWSSPASLQKTFDAGLWDQGLKQALAEHNMVVLNVAAGGPYQIYAKDFAVRTPADIEGRKWAVSGTTASKAIELMGGSPTTMSSGELYLALQRGTIDGTTRPLLTGLGRKLYEVNEHLTVANMAYFASFLVINKDSWEALPADIQAIMRDAAAQRSQDQLARLQDFLDQAIAKFEAQGVTVKQLDEQERQAFADQVEPVYDWWQGEVAGAGALIDFARRHQ